MGGLVGENYVCMREHRVCLFVHVVLVLGCLSDVHGPYNEQ